MSCTSGKLPAPLRPSRPDERAAGSPGRSSRCTPTGSCTPLPRRGSSAAPRASPMAQATSSSTYGSDQLRAPVSVVGRTAARRSRRRASRHAMITFSPSPFSRATRALCSRWVRGDRVEPEHEEVLKRRPLGHGGQRGVVAHHEQRVGVPRLGQQRALVAAGRRAHDGRGRGHDDARGRSTASSSGSRIQLSGPLPAGTPAFRGEAPVDDGLVGQDMRSLSRAR